jgi:hypothetical protein
MALSWRTAPSARLLAFLWPAVLFAAHGFAGSMPIPIVNAGQFPSPQKQVLETEEVQIGAHRGVPNTLHRKSGLFLLVVRVTPSAQEQDFVLEPTDKTPASPDNVSLNFSRHTPRVNGRQAAYLQLAKGSYQLKGILSGRTFCTLTID